MHRFNKTSLAVLLAEFTGLGVGSGHMYGDSGHSTGLDCPTGVLECSCGGDAVSACKSDTHEPVLASPSYGVTVASGARASSSYGWTSGGVVCVAAGRRGYCTM